MSRKPLSIVRSNASSQSLLLVFAPSPDPLTRRVPPAQTAPKFLAQVGGESRSSCCGEYRRSGDTFIESRRIIRTSERVEFITFQNSNILREQVVIPFLDNFTDVALLLLRLMVGLVFFSSGWSDVSDSEARSKSIEMSRGFTLFLGIAECAGALGVMVGMLTQFAAIGLIFLMFGAIQKKIFKWHTGFWGKHGTDGWSYDLMIITMNLVIATTDGGRFTLERVLH